MIRTLDKPCVEITCDECGVGDNAEYETCFHHGSERDAIACAEDQEWRVDRDDEGKVTRVTCSSCIESEREEAELAEEDET